MDADFSIELGPPREEAILELPWDSGEASGPRYLDLKRHPELLALVDEANRYPELGEFLRVLNAPASVFETVKCDVWSTGELGEDEQIYGAQWKLAAYVDLVFSEQEAGARFSFSRHEELARSLVKLLKEAPEIPAACEAIVRRCYYHQAPSTPVSRSGTKPGGKPEEQEPVLHSGFYISLYLFGYGAGEDDARKYWHMGLQLATSALLQLSAHGEAENQEIG